VKRQTRERERNFTNHCAGDVTPIIQNIQKTITSQLKKKEKDGERI
jgi:hypothetical protein